MAFDPAAPTIAYAATEGSGTFRSTDSGQTWARVGTDEPALDCVEHLAVERDGDHRVFAQACGEGLYVSHCHGISWTEGIPWSHGSWVEDILCTDDEPSLLYAATGGGMYRRPRIELAFGLVSCCCGGSSIGRAAARVNHVA
jgi:hypothetical protein